MAETDITAAWHLLEIMAIAQAVLMALFGVYFALFVLAMWANHGRSDISSRRLKTVTIVLFVNMVIFVLVRSLQFSRARVLHPPEREFFNWGIPLTVIGNIQTTTIGMLADGLLAWRFYVLYDQQRWALWVPMFFVIINALLCYSADAQHFAAYFNYDYYQNTLLEVTLSVTIAWGWVMMATNTVLTAGIITKIIMVARDSGTLRTYNTAIRAVIESSLVTWIGLCTYEISSLAPQGKVTSHLDVGFVLLLVLPVFFGISQCLIVARIALSNEFGSKTRKSTRDGTFSGAGTSSAGYSFATAPTPSANFKSVSFNQQQSTTFGTAHSTRTSDDDVTGIKPAEDERDVYELEMGRSRIGRAL